MKISDFFTLLALCSVSTIAATSEVVSFHTNAMLKTYIMHPEAVESLVGSPLLNSEPSWCVPQGTNISSNLNAYLKFSGRSPNDFGFWDSCQAIRNNATLMALSEPNYVNLYVAFGGAIPGYWGVCYPKACTQSITTLLASASQIVKTPILSVTSDELEPITLTRKPTVIMLIIASFLILLSIAGMIVEHTSLGEQSGPTSNQDDATMLVNMRMQEQILDEGSEAKHIQTPATVRSTNIQAFRNPPPVSQIPTKHPDPILRKKGVCCKFLACWSLSNNYKKLVLRQRPPSELDVLDGVRVLSIFWVIYGHSWFYMLFTIPRNSAQILTQDSSLFVLTFLFSALFAVDAFFYLSAFLATYLFLKKFPLKKKCMNPGYIFLAYFQRYYRLTFLLAFIMYFSAFVIYPLASGPGRMDLMNDNYEHCVSNGWANLLYINNFYPDGSKDCFGWGWYLANDMQMFLLLPWILFLYKFSRLFGILFLIVLFVINLITSFLISWNNDYNISGMWSEKSYPQKFYYVPWVRITPYLIGIVFGLLYVNYKDTLAEEAKINQQNQQHLESGNGTEAQKRKQKIRPGIGYRIFRSARDSDVYAWVYLCVGFSLCFVMTFIGYDVNRVQGNAWSKTGKAFYNTFARGLFGLGLGIALIPLVAGRFKLIIEVMSNDLFAVLAKMTYAAYLLHEVLLLVFMQSSKEAIYMSQFEAVVWCLAMLVLTHLVGSVMTILADIPFGNLDKYLLFPQKRK